MRQTSEGPLFNAWPVDPVLTEWAETVLQEYAQKQQVGLRKGAFVTVSSCSGTAERAQNLAARTGFICENMEGAAAALACQQTDTPFLELRAISNLVEKRDTSRWDLPAGMTAAQKAVLALLDAGPQH